MPIRNVGASKDDFKRTKREGKSVYLNTRTGEIVSPEQYKALVREQQASKDDSTPRPEKKPFFGAGKTLSKQEAAALEEPLTAALQDEFHIVDQLLWLRCPQLEERDIWGDVTEDEVSKTVELMLKGGQRNPVMAQTVRSMVDLHVYAVVGMMFAPRIQKTVQALRETPKRGQPIVQTTLFRRRKRGGRVVEADR